MPRIPIDLSGLTAARSALQDQVVAQRGLDAAVAAARAALDAATRAAQSPNFTVPLQVALQQAQADRAASKQLQASLSQRVDAIANGLLQQRDPSVMVGSMDGHQPIALMPMRIETRYLQPVPAAIDRLCIRVYPDDINTVAHVPVPTDAELQGGTAYWTARFARDDDDAARTLRDLALMFGRGRAAWVVRVMTPENVALLDDPVAPADPPAPVFPQIDTIDARAKDTRAVLLPDRWVAIGYAANRREVFRAWGGRIPDELLLSPDWLATDDAEALLGGDRAWMVDFDAALAKGMALQVTQDDVDAFARSQPAHQGFALATDTIERLVVFGLEWTKSAADSAADLTDLLAAQRDSTGLGFAPLGTPTNNTEIAPSGYSPDDERTPPAPPASTPATLEDFDALQLTTWALGIAPADLPPDNIANAHLSEQRTALHMMNVLWRGTMGQYLNEMWNGYLDDGSTAFAPARQYALRSYAVSYLRPAGPLPLLRIDKQPYAILPMVGRRFVDPHDNAVETNVAKVVDVLRSIWELAQAKVPLLKDGDLGVAQQALQTMAWSQSAAYRDRPADPPFSRPPNPLGDAQWSSRKLLIGQLVMPFGLRPESMPINDSNAFFPDPPYAPGYLAGVPWVSADPKDPTQEAPDETTLTGNADYFTMIANASIKAPADAATDLAAWQSGPALLQALAAYSVMEEQQDAAAAVATSSGAVSKVVSLATARMPHVETPIENEAIFTVQTAKELSQVSIPAVTGQATIGEFVAQSLAARTQPLPRGMATLAASDLFDAARFLTPATTNLGAVKLSLKELSTATVGTLNIAFRTTLDAFSYRLDAWITARANRRLEAMRARAPTGVYVGGYAWVENLKADARPDSDGYLLAPSLPQAASAAILRSGFLANSEQGAFDIALDSRRTRRALDILEGLTRDQPLAALYGYRIERGLRDGEGGRFIWPLRRVFPWRPLGDDSTTESDEAIGARDVVDGVALIDAWSQAGGPAKVLAQLEQSLSELASPGATPSADEIALLNAVIQDGADLADGIADLLLAEGTYQIVEGNLDRASAAMSVIDKQSLPVETRVDRTLRGGASYTQKIVVVCPAPDPDAPWPVDRRAATEPHANAWLASMMGDPARYRFTAQVHRVDGSIDNEGLTITFADLGLSPLSAVMLAGAVEKQRVTGTNETGFRSRLVDAFKARVDDPATVSGLDIAPSGDAPDTLGLAHFEAFAMTLKATLDKMRPATRKDVVRPDDAIEATLPDEGNYPGVDLDEIEARATTLIDDFTAVEDALKASVGADALLAALASLVDFLPSSSWPAEVFAIDAPSADPATRDDRAALALPAVVAVLDAKLAKATADVVLLKDQVAATHAQRVHAAIDRIQVLLGKDFPVLPRYRIGAYATEFSASLAEQDRLTVADPWRIAGWIAQVARVHDGSDRFAAAVSAHEALCAPLQPSDLKLVQFPHVPGQIWAALPEAWVEADGVAQDLKDAPEELHAWLAAQPGAATKNVQRAAPDLAIALHAPGGLDAIGADDPMAAMICDEWPEFIPDPVQTAAVAFNFDAPGARPPQTILLALPPSLDQDAWAFDDVVDVIHEAFDLAKLRAVRPRDLGSGLGALLPANYLPHTYTDDLPSVQMLKMQADARKRFVSTTVSAKKPALILGKV